jgi:hypothetical protein
MGRLGLKLACSFLGIPQLKRKLVCEIHGSRAVFLGHIGGLMQQRNYAISGVIRQHSGIRAPLLRVRGERNNRSWPLVLDAHHRFLP